MTHAFNKGHSAKSQTDKFLAKTANSAHYTDTYIKTSSFLDQAEIHIAKGANFADEAAYTSFNHYFLVTKKMHT